MHNVSESRRAGFTLIELLVVIAIIGILISLILVAAADGVRRAEERQTQALITKLETALNDRLDALLNTQAPINQTHRYLAAINIPSGNNYVPAAIGSVINSIDRRAQVIAQIDYLRAELPDVFLVNHLTQDGATASNSYPLNFAAAPYPAGQNSVGNFVLPLGNNINGLPDNTGTVTLPTIAAPITGMFGASFSAAGGIYKNLGYGPTGYDGVDNDGNGLIDDILESGTTVGAVNALLSNHTHKTARSEMLYAILVEGLSPLGSSFSRDDFTAREVQDTDRDGLPEFVDAWGEPLQFFRWPIYYGGASPTAGTILGTSDSQRGSLAYSGFSDAREQNPLDPNQLLMAPAWWSSAANASLTTPPLVSSFSTPTLSYASSGGAANQCSQGAMGFMHYFHILVDSNAGQTGGLTWDRGGSFHRRAYFSKFLILSAGPDREPGVAQFAKDYSLIVDSTATLQSGHAYPFPSSSLTMEQHALSLLFIENQASVSDPLARSGHFYEIPDPGSGTTATLYLQNNTNSDDITNHNISGISTGVR